MNNRNAGISFFAEEKKDICSQQVSREFLTASSCSQSSHYEVDKKRTLILSSLGRIYCFVLLDIIKTAMRIGFS